VIRVFLAHSWRTRWRALVVLALMVGLAGGASLAALAGARRSATALDRFGDAAQTLDVFVAADVTTPEPAAFRELLDGPLVESTNDLVFVMVDDQASGFVFAPTSRRGLHVEQGVLLEGRRADPDEADEVTLSERTAKRLRLGVGGTLEVGTLSKAQAEALFSAGTVPESLDGPHVSLRVVGITRTGFDLNAQQDTGALTVPTPAFWEKYGAEMGVGSRSHMVRVPDEPGAVARFTDAVEKAYGAEHLPSINVGQGEETVHDAISVATVALLAVAIVVAIAGIAWIGTAIARHQRLIAADTEVLRALGATAHERRVLLAGSVLPGILGGLALSIVVALALSPRFPVGTARRVDPDPGLHVDLVVLLAGLAVLVALLGLIAVLGAVRLVAHGRPEQAAPDMGVPTLAERAARWVRPAPGIGVRFALHAPTRTAAPYRPALIGALVGVIGLVGVAVVGANVQRLVDTPARWGAPWDVAVVTNALLPEASEPEPGAPPPRPPRAQLLANKDIVAAGAMVYDEQVRINGIEAISVTFAPVKGAITPTVVAGREPRADDEIAVARDTLADAGVDIGSTVNVASRSNQRGRYRIVGVIAFPSIGEPSPVATGALFTAEGGNRLRLGFNDSDDHGTPYVVIRWARGVDKQKALSRLAGVEEGAGFEAPAVRPIPPPEVSGLDDVRRFPLFVATALILLGVIATSHALFVTVGRRRLELGVLSAMGFTPSQRRVVVTVQATTIAIVALVLGMPLGAVLGRVIWSAIGGSIGLASDAVFPLALFAIGALGFVVALNAIALLPGQAARNLRPATALRSE
jgi:hypothetical protein